jgi:hypothetical protein
METQGPDMSRQEKRQRSGDGRQGDGRGREGNGFRVEDGPNGRRLFEELARTQNEARGTGSPDAKIRADARLQELTRVRDMMMDRAREAGVLAAMNKMLSDQLAEGAFPWQDADGARDRLLSRSNEIVSRAVSRLKGAEDAIGVSGAGHTIRYAEDYAPLIRGMVHRTANRVAFLIEEENGESHASDEYRAMFKATGQEVSEDRIREIRQEAISGGEGNPPGGNGNGRERGEGGREESEKLMGEIEERISNWAVSPGTQDIDVTAVNSTTSDWRRKIDSLRAALDKEVGRGKRTKEEIESIKALYGGVIPNLAEEFVRSHFVKADIGEAFQAKLNSPEQDKLMESTAFQEAFRVFTQLLNMDKDGNLMPYVMGEDGDGNPTRVKLTVGEVLVRNKVLQESAREWDDTNKVWRYNEGYGGMSGGDLAKVWGETSDDEFNRRLRDMVSHYISQGKRQGEALTLDGKILEEKDLVYSEGMTSTLATNMALLAIRNWGILSSASISRLSRNGELIKRGTTLGQSNQQKLLLPLLTYETRLVSGNKDDLSKATAGGGQRLRAVALELRSRVESEQMTREEAIRVLEMLWPNVQNQGIYMRKGDISLNVEGHEGLVGGKSILELISDGERITGLDFRATHVALYSQMNKFHSSVYEIGYVPKDTSPKEIKAVMEKMREDYLVTSKVLQFGNRETGKAMGKGLDFDPRTVETMMIRSILSGLPNLNVKELVENRRPVFDTDPNTINNYVIIAMMAGGAEWPLGLGSSYDQTWLSFNDYVRTEALSTDPDEQRREWKEYIQFKYARLLQESSTGEYSASTLDKISRFRRMLVNRASKKLEGRAKDAFEVRFNDGKPGGLYEHYVRAQARNNEAEIRILEAKAAWRDMNNYYEDAGQRVQETLLVPGKDYVPNEKKKPLNQASIEKKKWVADIIGEMQGDFEGFLQNGVFSIQRPNGATEVLTPDSDPADLRNALDRYTLVYLSNKFGFDSGVQGVDSAGVAQIEENLNLDYLHGLVVAWTLSSAEVYDSRHEKIDPVGNAPFITVGSRRIRMLPFSPPQFGPNGTPLNAAAEFIILSREVQDRVDPVLADAAKRAMQMPLFRAYVVARSVGNEQQANNYQMDLAREEVFSFGSLLPGGTRVSTGGFLESKSKVTLATWPNLLTQEATKKKIQEANVEGRKYIAV